MHTPLSTLLDDKGHSVQTISPNNTVYECALKMDQFRVGALLVMEGDGVRGIISERDIFRKLIVPGQDPKKCRVEELMTTDLLTVLPSTTVREAMHIVTERRFRHLPVVENGKLVGLISIGDLTRWAMLAQEHLITDLTRYIQGGR